MTPRAAVAALIAALLVLAPRVAAACPYCAGREEDGGVLRGVVIGAMIVTPFVAVAVAVPLIVRMVRRAEARAAATVEVESHEDR